MESLSNNSVELEQGTSGFSGPPPGALCLHAMRFLSCKKKKTRSDLCHSKASDIRNFFLPTDDKFMETLKWWLCRITQPYITIFSSLNNRCERGGLGSDGLLTPHQFSSPSPSICSHTSVDFGVLGVLSAFCCSSFATSFCHSNRGDLLRFFGQR